MNQGALCMGQRVFSNPQPFYSCNCQNRASMSRCCTIGFGIFFLTIRPVEVATECGSLFTGFHHRLILRADKHGIQAWSG
jgi:hypothetical protein